jgi:predicted RNase H-like nuclease
MALILGVDAAWTERGSSGVALLKLSKNMRRVIALAPSYAVFGQATIDWFRPPGGPPDVAKLLRTAEKIGGAPVDVVAVDMPMAKTPITGRRVADQKVSQEFGGRVGASVHSPNELRPGAHGKRIVDAIRDAGFRLVTTNHIPGTRSLIEVFPLAALVRLMRAKQRPR